MGVDEKVGVGNSENKDEKPRPWVVDLLALFFIGRGLVNIITFMCWGEAYYASILGGMSHMTLEFLFVVSGVGIFRRERWGYFIGLLAAVVATITQADDSVLKRFGARSLSMIMAIGLFNVRFYFKKIRKIDLIITIVLILLGAGMFVYEVTRPTQSDIQKHYTNLALENMDPSFCDNIEVRNHRESCYVRVNTLIQDPSLCDKLEESDKRGACFRNIAESQKNISYCYKIENSYSKNFCIKRLGGQTE